MGTLLCFSELKRIEKPVEVEGIDLNEDIIENSCKLCKSVLPFSEWQSKPIVKCPVCGTLNNNLQIIEDESEQFAPIPNIKIRWDRFQQWIHFQTKPLTFLALGVKDSGKSTLLECIAIRYRKIIDLYGSSDMESLGWCKPEFSKVWRAIHGREPRILLVCGESKDISSKFDSIKIGDLTLQDIEDHDIITSVSQFFESEDQYFEALSKIVKMLWTQRNYWTEIWYLMVREAANWLYARTKTVKDDKFAKAEFLKAMRESRHHGLSMAADMLRWTSLDKEIRDLSDYTFVKCLGSAGLPDDLHWLYRYFMPYSLMQMKPRTFGLLTGRGSVGHGVFDYCSWHKTEHENILKIAGIEIKDCDRAAPDERTYNLGAFEHAEMIKTYIETKSMNKTATATARSFKTVRNHLLEHNMGINQLGECQKCFNSKGEFSKQKVEIGKVGRPQKSEVIKRASTKTSTESAPVEEKKAKHFQEVSLE